MIKFIKESGYKIRESKNYDVANNLYKDPMKQALADYLADTIIDRGVYATDIQDANKYLEDKGFYVDFQFEDVPGEWEAFEKYIKVLVDGWCKDIITYDKDENGKYIRKESVTRRITEKSNFDDTEKAINYYYPKWYYDDMSVNDIYDDLEKLGHSQDFIDAVIDGITSRYENEEDYGLDDYDECLTEDSLDDIVRPEIKKRYIWPLYEDCNYEIVEIIEKYQNTNRFKNEIKGFDLNDISYMDWPALQLEIECSYDAYVLIRKDIEREGLFVDDDDDIDESIQESKVGDVEDSKLPKRAKDYLKSMGWDSANIDGDVYYTMHFSESEDCDIYIDEFGNCYLVVDEYDVKPTDMFYTIVDDYKTDIDDLMKLGDMVASGNDVDKVMELFFG